MNYSRKLAACTALLAAALISVLFLSKIFSSPGTYREKLAYLDGKRTTATELSASAAGLAIGITLVPDDIATPIADELADLATDFLIVLTALTAEKYLLTLSGYVVFTWLLPFVLIGFALNLFIGSRVLKKFLSQIFLFCLVLLLVIPVSVRLSQIIDRTYGESISAAVDSAQGLAAEMNLELETSSDTELPAETEAAPAGESAASEEEEKTNPLRSGINALGNAVTGARDTVAEKASQIAEGASELVSGAAGTLRIVQDLPAKAGTLLNRFIEALVVMIVTTCVIPILTFFLMLWLINHIFGSGFELPALERLDRRYHKKENV